MLASAATASTPPYSRLLRLFAYDARPLAFQGEAPTREDGVLVSDVSYASPKRGKVRAKLTRPDRTGRFPAVLFQTNGVDDFRDEAVILARRGIVSLILDPPFTREGGRPLFGCTGADLQNYVQNIVELRRGIDILAARPDVDGSQIGFVGHSYGAQIGGILSGVDKRVKAFVLMTGGAYQTHFLRSQCGWLGAKRLAAYLRVLSQIDPARYVPHAAPAALFIQSALHDQFVPRADALALQRLASKPKTVKWYDAGHELNATATRNRDDWLAAQLAASSG